MDNSDKPQLIKQSQIFDEKIKSINSQFVNALDDFKKYYVYYNKNPEVNEFQNYYSNSKGQLQTMSKNLFYERTSEKTIFCKNRFSRALSKKLLHSKGIFAVSKNIFRYDFSLEGSETFLFFRKERFPKFTN